MLPLFYHDETRNIPPVLETLSALRPKILLIDGPGVYSVNEIDMWRNSSSRNQRTYSITELRFAYRSHKMRLRDASFLNLWVYLCLEVDVS